MEYTKHSYQPGDVIAFGGYQGLFTWLIRAATFSPVSHVGIISHVEDGRPYLAESTTLYTGRSGYQENDLFSRLADYENQGRAWWLPLSKQSRAHLDPRVLRGFLQQQHGKKYDFVQVAGVPLARVPLVGKVLRPDDYRRLFCSELVGAAFEHTGILQPEWNSSHMTPEQICQLRLYQPAVQVLGKPRAIRGYAKIRVFFPEEPLH